jgi:hypothetical protein
MFRRASGKKTGSDNPRVRFLLRAKKYIYIRDLFVRLQTNSSHAAPPQVQTDAHCARNRNKREGYC